MTGGIAPIWHLPPTGAFPGAIQERVYAFAITPAISDGVKLLIFAQRAFCAITIRLRPAADNPRATRGLAVPEKGYQRAISVVGNLA
jgi:hypothetical protein